MHLQATKVRTKVRTVMYRHRGYDRHDWVSVEVSLQWPFSAGVQSGAMKPASEQLGVPQLEGDHINFFSRSLIPGCRSRFDDYRARIDAEGVHVDSVTANQHD